MKKILKKYKKLIFISCLFLGLLNMNSIAYYGIELYQSYISPYKGYDCAYSVLNKTSGCSEMIQQIITSEGLIRGWNNITNQCKACTNALQILKTSGDFPRDFEICTCCIGN